MKKILPLICLAVSLGATAQATFGHFDQIRLNQNTAQTKNMHKTGQLQNPVEMLKNYASVKIF